MRVEVVVREVAVVMPVVERREEDDIGGELSLERRGKVDLVGHDGI